MALPKAHIHASLSVIGRSYVCIISSVATSIQKAQFCPRSQTYDCSLPRFNAKHRGRMWLAVRVGGLVAQREKETLLPPREASAGALKRCGLVIWVERERGRAGAQKGQKVKWGKIHETIVSTVKNTLIYFEDESTVCPSVNRMLLAHGVHS